MADAYSERLFSYGTLQQEAVQLANFGRRLEGVPDAVMGNKLSSVRITDPEVVAESGLDVHQILVPSDNPKETVLGVVFAITEQELRAADEYKTDAYQRVRVKLRSGIVASDMTAADDYLGHNEQFRATLKKYNPELYSRLVPHED